MRKKDEKRELQTEFVALAQQNYREKSRKRNKYHNNRGGLVAAICTGVLTGVVTVLTTTAVMAGNGSSEFYKADELYATTTVVVEVDHVEDIITVRNGTGYKYPIRGAEDWFVGDICSVLMYENGTGNISDDIPVSWRYSGTAESFEVMKE